jgi:hypothetical protein
MWCHEDLVRTDVSEECVASIFREERISKLGTVLAMLVTVPNSLILATLKMEVTGSS